MRHSSYKYYSKRTWAEEFLDGKLLFHSLSFYRDYEDSNVRGDRNEGTSVFRPKGGLVINNQTQAKTFTLPRHAFKSAANQEEIFVFCASRSFTDELREKFKAMVCVEILRIQTFCERIEAALPHKATFPGPRGRTRIGQRVEYYHETEGGNPRWALPDKIATSKFDCYSWQDEYRLVFCLTDALGFEKVGLCLAPDDADGPPKLTAHAEYPVVAGSLRDVCRLHEF
jgi:hypothetical protein